MKILTVGTLFSVLICVSVLASAKDKHEWETGTLVSINDYKTNRV